MPKIQKPCFHLLTGLFFDSMRRTAAERSLLLELRTPFGCRDTLTRDLRKRKALCRRILDVFDTFGFEEVSTPAMEYYQTYNQAFAALEDRQMVKLFDDHQDIVTLRMDMTVPIARLASTALRNAPLPLRLSYWSDVWKLRKALSGKAIQTSDCGVELIGSSDDLQILVCALETLKAVGLRDYRLELSDARLLEQSAKKVFDNPEDIRRLAELCDKKSMVELEAFLKEHDLDEKQYRFFASLPLLEGGMEALQQAKDLAFDESTIAVLDELKATYEFLEKLGYGDVIGFDLGKLPHLNYYTGLLFEAFVPGASNAVLTGGRYDNLMEAFGASMPAIGFGVKIDPLVSLLPDPDLRTKIVIAYPKEQAQEAFKAAANIRQSFAVCLLEDSTLSLIETRREVRP